jgi:hypothetical protein
MGRIRTGAALAAVILPLAACGGGGGDDDGGSTRPEIALKGASYATAEFLPALNPTEGGDGGRFRSVIFVDDGVAEFLGREQSSSGGTTVFRADDGSVAFVTALPGFESAGLIRIEYAQTGLVTEGVIGRFTTDARMATASGSAVYQGGPGTAEVRVERTGILQSFDLTRGSTTVTVDFGTRAVDATLDFRGTPSGSVAQVDRVEIGGMRISGNRFSGGALNAFKGASTTPNPTFSVSSGNLASSGIFAGWNDTTGAVAGGNLPAEVAGAFVANAGSTVLKGRYVAD